MDYTVVYNLLLQVYLLGELKNACCVYVQVYVLVMSKGGGNNVCQLSPLWRLSTRKCLKCTLYMCTQMFSHRSLLNSIVFLPLHVVV